MEFVKSKHPTKEIIIVEALPKNNTDHDTINLFRDFNVDIEDARIVRLIQQAKDYTGLATDKILSTDVKFDKNIFILIHYHSK